MYMPPRAHFPESVNQLKYRAPSMALNLKSVDVYRIKDVFFVVFWILCLRCWLRATWLSDQSGFRSRVRPARLIYSTARTNISRHRTVWGKRLAGSRKYRCGSRVPWFGQRKIPASDKFNHHLLAAVCGGSSQPFQKQQLLRAGTPRHYLARGLAMLA
ncbi:hypothetical protein D5086_026603 [Populus alba]|uniref:Uncharacterized protein n=1 Tax=Populus alba TaxID=43335 RepID=A0ACC4B2A6_POPAL